VFESRKQNENTNLYHGKDELLANEIALHNYNHLIIKLFLKHSKLDLIPKQDKQDFRVLDFGAGIGSLGLIWRDITKLSVECLEIDPSQIEVVKSRGFSSYSSLAQVDKEFDFIYSSNVLEHIYEDEECIKDLSGILHNGGRIAIYVPAFQILFSAMDHKVGHYRRYSKKELIRKIENAGLKVITTEYIDSLGFVASIAIKIFGWKGVGNLGGFKSLKIYDRYIFPISRAIDFLSRGKLFGKNILLIAEKIHP